MRLRPPRWCTETARAHTHACQCVVNYEYARGFYIFRVAGLRRESSVMCMRITNYRSAYATFPRIRTKLPYYIHVYVYTYRFRARIGTRERHSLNDLVNIFRYCPRAEYRVRVNFFRRHNRHKSSCVVNFRDNRGISSVTCATPAGASRRADESTNESLATVIMPILKRPFSFLLFYHRWKEILALINSTAESFEDSGT